MWKLSTLLRYVGPGEQMRQNAQGSNISGSSQRPASLFLSFREQQKVRGLQRHAQQGCHCSFWLEQDLSCHLNCFMGVQTYSVQIRGSKLQGLHVKNTNWCCKSRWARIVKVVYGCLFHRWCVWMNIFNWPLCSVLQKTVCEVIRAHFCRTDVRLCYPCSSTRSRMFQTCVSCIF